MRNAAILCVLVLAAAALADPTSQPAAPLPPEALSAKRAYQQAINQIASDYNAKVAAAKVNYLKRLNAAMANQTKAGNLDTALSVRQEIAILNADKPAPPDPDAPPDAYLGKWHVKWSNGTDYVYVIKADAVDGPNGLRCTDPHLLNGVLTLKWGDKGVDQFVLFRGVMITASWWPEHDMNGFPVSVGIGEKVD